MDLTPIEAMISSPDPSVRREAAMLLADSGTEAAFVRLESLLQDPNHGVRDAAQNAIILLGGRAEIEKMVRLLTHKDPALRNTAIEILRRIGDDGLDILHGLARHPDDNIRLFVLDILGSIGSIESLDTLIKGLSDTNPNVRNAAVVSLGELGDPRAFEHLSRLIDDEEWIRFSVIEALASIPHDGVVRFLLDGLNRFSDDDITMCAILETLGKIGSSDAIRPLLGLISGGGGYVEITVARTLLKGMSCDDIERLGSDDRTRMKLILETHLDEADDSFQRAILKTLALIGDRTSAERIIALAGTTDPDSEMEKWEDIKSSLCRLADVSQLIDLLDRDEPAMILASEILAKTGTQAEALEIAARVHAAQGTAKRAMTRALAEINGTACRECFLQLIHDPDGHVVSPALQALGKIGNPTDIRELEQFLRHPYPDVNTAALEAIVAIGGTTAEDTFGSLLSDSDPSIRIMALAGLRGMNSAHLVQAVRTLSGDDQQNVRMAAVKLIRDAALPVEKDLLGTLLNDEFDEVRHLAMDLVGQRGIGDFRPFVEEAASSEDLRTAHHAVEALGKFHDEAARTRLLNILASGPDLLRISAACALGRWGEESLFSDLEVYLDDDNPDVVRAVRNAMDTLQGGTF